MTTTTNDNMDWLTANNFSVVYVLMHYRPGGGKRLFHRIYNQTDRHRAIEDAISLARQLSKEQQEDPEEYAHPESFTRGQSAVVETWRSGDTEASCIAFTCYCDDIEV